MTLRLRAIVETNIPREVAGILPEKLSGKTLRQIEHLEVLFGNQKRPLAEFFQVSGDPSDEVLDWEGNLAGIHWLGANMTRGRIHVNGPVGRHLGSQMRAGQITVDGDAGDWVGAEMAGGLIRVHGNAGHQVAAAYRGSARGVTGGTVLIHGNAGNEIGCSMRRGLLAVAGSVGDLIGFNMLAGSILVFGSCGIRPGAGMRRGTIGLFGSNAPQPLSTFRHACHGRFDIQLLMSKSLERLQFPAASKLYHQPIDLYHGDLLEGGRGELLIGSAT